MPRGRLNTIWKTAEAAPREPYFSRAPSPAAAELDRVQKSASAGSYLERHRQKLAEASAVADIGLRLSQDLISFSPSRSAQAEGDKVASNVTSGGAISPQKLAAAASVIGRQTALIEELKSAHEHGVKVAAALAGAVKLAQDGAIDLEDIFEVAREALEKGSVKVSTVDSLFTQHPGELVGEERKNATADQKAESSDVLTSTLRGLRRVR